MNKEKANNKISPRCFISKVISFSGKLSMNIILDSIIYLLMWRKAKMKFRKKKRNYLRFKENLNNKENMVILNLGCGNESFGDVRVDIYPTRTTTHVMNVELGLPKKWSNKFDVVYSKNLLEHLRNPGFVLEEMKRVCKPGGKIVIITDNAGFWEFHFFGTHVNPVIPLRRLHFYKGKSDLDTHYSLFTKEHLINHFNKVGLIIKEVEYIHFDKNEDLGKFRPLLDIICRLLAATKIFKNFAYPRIKIVGMKVKNS
jgi:SAM-dependent methyltransferase